MNSEHINSWKTSTKTFHQQLSRNLYELNKEYPPHWKHFLQRLELNQQIQKVIDVGCGVGGLYSLIQKHFPNIKYIGFDYSEHAIELAKQQWQAPKLFFVKNYTELTPDMFSDDTLLVANALADVLPNGDECIQSLLDLNSKYVQFLRVRITNEPSYFDIYNAYDIKTYAFYHNYGTLYNMIRVKQYKFYVDHYASDIKDLFLIKDDDV